MINKVLRYLKSLRSMQRVNMALARGAATSALRNIDIRDPSSWEFSGFSQNGEDGIIDVLTRHIIKPNRYFIEIGASDGIENNTAWLAMARRFSGIWVEGDPDTSKWCEYMFTALNYGVESVCMFVTKENASEFKSRVLHTNPDVFSLDIDGNDYYVADAILSAGFKPRIFVVEYNSAFGPENSVTIPYRDDFRCVRVHGDNLYYGCSISGWKTLFAKYGYTFVTVDVNGVNGFFIDATAFDENFVKGIGGLDFEENFAQLREYRKGWKDQYTFVEKRQMVTIA